MAALAVLFLTFGIYANSFDGEFLWDDETLITLNPFVRQASLTPKIFTTTLFDGAGNYTNFYRPLQTASYVVDRMLWKFNVFGYHLTNTLFHALAALAVFWLSWALLRNFAASFLAALFFASHPTHTEAVAYISGRADPMAALFLLSAMVFYLRRRLLWMSLCLILGLLCRENAMMLLPMILFYHFAWRVPLWKKGFWMLVALSLGYLFIRHHILSGLVIASVAPNQPSTWERLPSFFVAFPQYLRLLVFPFHLHMEYGSILFPWSDPSVLWGLLAFSAFVGVLLWARQRSAPLFWCLGFFLLGLLPVSHLFLINAYMAEHWLYLPSLGFFWLLAIALSQRKSLWILAGAIVIYFSALTVYQNHFWRDPVLLYKNLMRYAPHSSKVYNNLAKVYHEKGQADELITLLEKAISVNPDDFTALNNLGNALKDAGRYKEAEAAYRKAIKLEPTRAHQYMNLSLLYSEVYKDVPKAIELLNAAIRVNPRCAEAYHQLAFLAMQDEEWEKAIGYLKKELSIYPDQALAFKSLGYIYYRRQEWGLAEEAYKMTIKAKPDYGEAYHDLAVIYSGQGKANEADTALKRSVELGYKEPGSSRP